MLVAVSTIGIGSTLSALLKTVPRAWNFSIEVASMIAPVVPPITIIAEAESTNARPPPIAMEPPTKPNATTAPRIVAISTGVSSFNYW
jgi:hypothetical protein